MVIVLFAPGAGKGTQSAFLLERMNFIHISTGNLFRTAIKDKTNLGLKAQSYMDKGHLVPDAVVIDLIKEQLRSLPADQNIILDGFPRTLAQAKALDELLLSMNKKLDKALFLSAPVKALVERMSGRRVAENSGCVYHIKFNPPKKEGFCDKTGEKLIHRKDDQPEVVKQRLKAYLQQTTPLMEYYQKQNILHELEGLAKPEVIFQQIQKILPNGNK